MYQQLFDEAIGDPPPSTVDIDRVIDRQRRGMNRRRLGALGGSLTVMLLAGALFWAVPPNDPAPTAPVLGSPTVSPPADNEARLSKAANDAVTAAMPGVHLDATFEMLQDHKDTGLSYSGAALITVGGRRGRVSINVQAGSFTAYCQPAHPDCVTTTGPQGEKVWQVGDNNAVIVRGDGTAVTVNVAGIQPGAQRVSTPTITAAQVVAIGEYPGLRIMP
jgi:hypothetical protein